MSDSARSAIREWANPIILSMLGVLLTAQLVEIKEMKERQMIAAESMSEMRTEIRTIKRDMERMERRMEKLEESSERQRSADRRN